jgi:hypothetical protein
LVLSLFLKGMGFLFSTVSLKGITMPAIVPIEDLKAAQKEGLGIYAMRYALCCMKMAQDRLEEFVWSPHGKGSSDSKAG